MKKIRFRIRQYFGFSQREVNGFLSLLVIMVLLIVAPFLFNTFYKPAFVSSVASDKQLLDSLVAQLEAKQPAEKGQQRFVIKTTALRPFNPNKLTVEQWQEFGLPKYMGQRIINYRNKVSDFTYKAELGKIYGLPDSVFQRLYPFIDLPENKPSRYGKQQAVASAALSPDRYEKREYRKDAFVLAPFNINTADTTQLKQIRGIGSKLSARIVKYREVLGGFHTSSQLKEVFGLQPEIVDSLQKYSYIPKTYTLQQLSLNKASVEELRAHPYISSNLARAIVAYREQHGPYRQVDDIRQIKLLTQELYEKLVPYLTL